VKLGNKLNPDAKEFTPQWTAKPAVQEARECTAAIAADA